MIKLIKNGVVYRPDFLGKQDILIVDQRIGAIEEHINAEGLPSVEVLDANGKIFVPGFIDNHVHIMGEAEREVIGHGHQSSNFQMQ